MPAAPRIEQGILSIRPISKQRWFAIKRNIISFTWHAPTELAELSSLFAQALFRNPRPDLARDA